MRCTTLARAILLLTLFGIPALGEELPKSLVNPGLEEADAASDVKLAKWHKVGGNPLVEIDVGTKFSGRQSVRIVREPAASFGGIGQTIDATIWRGKAVELKAMLRVGALGAGSAGLWFRADVSGSGRGEFSNTYADPPPDDGSWVSRRAVMMVPADATHLLYGAIISSSGTLWADEFSLQELRPGSAQPPTPEAERYLKIATEAIHRLALNADRVDWEKSMQAATLLASGSTTPSATHPAIRYLLRQLGDNHSHLVPAQGVIQRQSNANIESLGIAAEKIDAVAYIAVPGYAGGTASRDRAFVDEIRGHIARLSAAGACGWIVDLRENDGGNMWPMLAGLAPLIGAGDAGAFVSRSGKAVWGIGATGAVLNGSRKTGGESKAAFVQGGKAPIAVLTGPTTGSSGEAIVVAFKGRANTRSFGQRTAGLSTGNSIVDLPDGSQLLITTSVYADRNGITYGGSIEPDSITAPAEAGKLLDDSTIRAGIDWLVSAPACRKR